MTPSVGWGCAGLLAPYSCNAVSSAKIDIKRLPVLGLAGY